VLPRENAREIEAAPEGIEVIAVSTVVEALAALGVRVPVPLSAKRRRTKVTR
jgi:hypothetical protein